MPRTGVLPRVFQRPLIVFSILLLVSLTTAQLPTNSSTLPIGSCTATIPCSNGACCNSISGFCGFGPSFCTPIAEGGPCTSNCGALAECGPFAAAANRTCPLNVCCSQFGFCGTTSEFCGTGCQSGCNQPGQQSCGADQASALHRRIGYYEGWAVQSSSRACSVYPPESISAETLTHINFAFALISETFQIIEMTPGDAALWTRTTALKKRNIALKVYLSIGGWSFNDPPTQRIFSQLVGSDANIRTFISSTLQTLQAYGFDGIDVDWEYPAAYDRGGVPADRERYPIFMAQVKAAFRPHGYGLTFTAPSSYWYLQHFDLPALMRAADWVNVMTYDLHGTWDGVDPYIGSIVLAHTNLTEVKQTMQLFANVGVKPDQIVLGIGFYGRSFQLADSECSSPGCGFVGGAAPGICSLNSGTLMFSEIETIIAANNLEPTYDDTNAVKYIVWNNDQWVSYDDIQTLKQKVQYANSICLGGTMIWSVDQDDTSYTALSALYPDINKPSRVESGNMCQITGCGQACPAGYVALTTLTSNPSVSVTCDPKQPSSLCCPPGLEPQGCHWSGGGGFTCNAQCDVGEIVLALDEVGGDGTPTCVQGYKAFCCKSGQLDPGGCFAAGCTSTSCASGYQVQTRVRQGSQDNGGCEAQGPPAAPQVCPVICASNTKPVCCQEGFGYTNCEWVGEPPNCFNAVCRAGQVALFSDMQGDAGQACTNNKRLYCCDPPLNAAFLPVPEEWVFPTNSPVGSGYSVHQPATFTVDFDDDTGGTSGAGSSGAPDDGRENDSPFGEVFISSPNAGSVSSLDVASDWVITDCLRSSDQPQQVLAYCSKPLDDPESGCAHVFIGQTEHTIVRMPRTCGIGLYARIISLEIHSDQSVLSGYHATQAKSPVYSLHFDYNFVAIPDQNGPVLMRADLTDMPGYWDAMINSPPDAGTTTTKRKRDFHQPSEFEKRWFGPFDSWLQRVSTFSNGGSAERNFHWSDTYEIFHQEESCPNFSSVLDIGVSGTASVTSAFGYYLEASVVPPAIQQAYVYLKAGAGAQATFTITGLAEAHFDSERAELAVFGFPGLYYPGLLTLGPSLHLYGQLTGQLSLSGRFSTSIGYQFPPVDMSFGRQDGNGDEENGFQKVTPNNFNQGYDYSIGYNVNLDGNAEAHLIPSFQIGLSVLGGALMDAQVFVEADLYAGVAISGSVSSAVAAQFCINPHYGVNLQAGVTGSLAFWRDNALSVNLYSADFPFGQNCFSSVDQGAASGRSKRDEMKYNYTAVSRAGQGTWRDTRLHLPSKPAYLEYRHPSGDVRRVAPTTVRRFDDFEEAVDTSLKKRGSVPFLPGALFCPAQGNQIGSPNNCFLYDPDEDGDQVGDRLAKRAEPESYSLSNYSTLDGELVQRAAEGHRVNSNNSSSLNPLTPFHLLDKSTLKTCKNFIRIPNYGKVSITGYYDLQNPGTLSIDLQSYNPIPVDLGDSLIVREGVSVYGREHVYEESLAAIFIDYLQKSEQLWRDAPPLPGRQKARISWCNWVKTHLQRTPSYFSGGSVFTRLGNCYPSNNIAGSSMPALESNTNTCKNLAMYDMERQFIGAGTRVFKTDENFRNKCATAQVGSIRSMAGVVPFMNDFLVQQKFIAANTCVRDIWDLWYQAYTAAINVDAPDRGNVDVPNLYDNWIHAIIANMPVWIKSQVEHYISLIPDPSTINLSLSVLLDNSVNRKGNPVNPGNVPFVTDVQVTRAELTNNILNQIGDITWVNQLPTH